ncbi:hypothetical protein ACFQ1S_30445, partial [Kibdelosporangium lantanae]
VGLDGEVDVVPFGVGEEGGGGLDGGCESRTFPLAPWTGGELSPKKPPAAQPTITSAITTPLMATMRRRQ